jgi:GTP-binding protein
LALRTVVIVGRPNVGKSTLFNRVIGERRAVVHQTPGVTRDRIAERTEWGGHPFLLLDTGGIVPFGETVSQFDRVVTDLAVDAAAEADVVLFVVDGQTGVTAWDQHIAEILRKSGRPVVLAVNKAEKQAVEMAAPEFWKLGVGEPFPLSALHGRGVGDLLDRVVSGFPTEAGETACDCRVAIVGRPNVGKSSLLNLLVGRDEAIVSDVPGTTRDAIHTDLKWHGRTLRLIDTAGLRRRSRVEEAVEVFAAVRTERVIEECDVAILMVDAAAGTVQQDARIAGQIHDHGKGIVVAFNKWDLVEKDHKTHLTVWENFLREVPFLSYAQWITLSAVTRQRSAQVLDKVWAVHEGRQVRVETGELNRFLETVVREQPPRTHEGHQGRIYFGVQAESSPPVIVLSVNEPSYFARHYLRFLNNRLREAYGFTGTRIHIRLKRH